MTTGGVTPLMDQIHNILDKTSDPQLKADFLSEVLLSQSYYHRTQWMEEWIVQGISHFRQVTDPVPEYLPRALQFLYRAQELAKSSGDNEQQCGVLIHLARYKLAIGDYSTAQLFAIEAQQVAEVAMNLYLSARASYMQAVCARCFGNYQESVTQLCNARKLLEICGLSRGYNACLITAEQAEVYLLKSEYSQAQTMFRDLTNMTSLYQNGLLYVNALLNITYIDIQVNEPAEIVWSGFNRAVEISSTFGCPDDIVSYTAVKAVMELREHKSDLADMHFKECLDFCQGGNAWLQSFCLEHLANIRAWPATGIQSRWPVVYLSFSSRSKDKLALHKALLFLGDIFLANNDEDTAFTLYTVALEGFTCMDVHRSRAQCMLRLGDLKHKHGNIAAAVVHWNSARPLFEQSLQAKDIIQIDSTLAVVEKAHEEGLDKLAVLETPTQLFSQVSISEEDSPKVILV
ncbi:hypothetical protein C8R45DRAFT_937326 [Mycena sanguinolenta]|nr:hypothetical protein C8R45DRAFT_937326 [Mycena sanguinolenta]